ncbi:ATPase, partial [Pseudomonas sp. Pseusp97]
MRNDTFDEFDDVPHLSTDAADRDEFGHHPRRVVEPSGRPVRQPVKRGGGTGALWALVAGQGLARAGGGGGGPPPLVVGGAPRVGPQGSVAQMSAGAPRRR